MKRKDGGTNGRTKDRLSEVQSGFLLILIRYLPEFMAEAALKSVLICALSNGEAFDGETKRAGRKWL